MPTIEQRLLKEEHIVQFDIVITQEELLSKVQGEVKKIAKEGKIKGFRPGHAPLHWVRNMYGDSLLRSAFQHLLESELNTFISTSTLPLIDAPVLAERSGALPTLTLKNLQGEYRVSFEVGLYPETIKGLGPDDEYEKIVVEVPDEVATQELAKIALRYGQEKEVSDSVVLGDSVEVDLVELLGDAPKEGGVRRQTRFVLSEKMPDEIKEAFIGRKSRDVVRVRLSAVREAFSEAAYRRLLGLSDDHTQEIGDWFEVTLQRIYRVEPAEMTEAFFQEHFGEDVRTEQEALARIKRAVQDSYADFIAERLVQDVVDRLRELNDFPWPERYMKALFAKNAEISQQEDAASYEVFLDSYKGFFLIKHLRKVTGADPSNDDVLNELIRRAHRQLSGTGLEHLLESFISRMVQDRQTVEDARNTLIVRKVAAQLPSLVSIRERRMTLEEIEALRSNLYTVKMKRYLEQKRVQAAETPETPAEENASSTTELVEKP